MGGSVLSLLTYVTQEGVTPLNIASQNGHTDVVDTLIRAGASVNQARMV